MEVQMWSHAESGGKNTYVKAIEYVGIYVEIHLLFHTFHQLCANSEQTSLTRQKEK